MNGDGYSDIVIGSPEYARGLLREGAAFIYHGCPSTSSAQGGWSAEGNQSNAQFGWSVATVGDVNGDGYSDLAVGAPMFDNGAADEGTVFIYHGGPSGPSSTASWTDEGDQVGAHYGHAVAGAGDVNGDGYSDVIIGAPDHDNGQLDEGMAIVHHGSAGGLATTPAWTFEGDQDGAKLGTSVCSAGDVNADGYSEVIAGAPYFDSGQADEGMAFVFHGSITGLPPAPNWTFQSDQAGARLGESVAGMGSVNGDAFGDVAIGAPGWDNGHVDEGKAYAFHGAGAGLAAAPAWQSEGQATNRRFGASVASVGDVNGDGINEVLVGGSNGAWVYLGRIGGITDSYVGTAPNFDSNGSLPFVGQRCSGAGDVNGDGYSDVVAGEITWDNPQIDEGRASVLHGGPAGLGMLPNWTVESNESGSGFGIAAGAAGDVNGDGYGDVIVGSHLHDNGEVDEGRVVPFYGNDGTGRRNNLRLYNTNLTAPISASNIPAAQFGAGLYAKPFLGRQRTRMVWETRTQGQAFSSASGRITNSTASTAQQATSTLTATAGTELKDLVTKPTSPNTINATAVRARPKYPLTTALTGQVYGPWRYMPGHLDGHGTHNNVPLPVEMLWMEAECDGGTPTLSWATATEQNNSHFVIERSIDVAEWVAVGQVEGAGHSQQQIEYSWSDPAPAEAPVVYYRLRQVDLDGREEELAMLPLEACAGVSSELTVLPNPTQGMVAVRWSSADPTSGSRELRVLDTEGWILHQEEVNADAPGVLMDLSHLTPGVYMVNVRAGDRFRTQRLVRQ